MGLEREEERRIGVCRGRELGIERDGEKDRCL